MKTNTSPIFRLVVLLFFVCGVLNAQVVLKTAGQTAVTPPITCLRTPSPMTLQLTTATGYPAGSTFVVKLYGGGPNNYNLTSPVWTSTAGPITNKQFRFTPTNAPAGNYRVRLVHPATGAQSDSAPIINIVPPYVVDSLSLSGTGCANDSNVYGINLGPSPFYSTFIAGQSSYLKTWKRNGVIINTIPGFPGLQPNKVKLTIPRGIFWAGDIIKGFIRQTTGCYINTDSTRGDTLAGIRLENLRQAQYCPGDVIANIQFARFKLAPGDTFYVQLSDSAGKFTNPALRAKFTQSPGSLTIPLGFPVSNLYQIRVLYGRNAGPCRTSNLQKLTIGTYPGTVSARSTALRRDSGCLGNPMKFVARYKGITNPNFKWKVNGDSVYTSTDTTFTTSALKNNDTVQVFMSSRSGCGTSVAISNKIVVFLDSVPRAPQTRNDTACGLGVARLGASGAKPGQKYIWRSIVNNRYRVVGYGPLFKDSLLFPALATDTFSVTLSNGICEGPPTLVFARYFNAPPQPIILGSSVHCDLSGDSITATASSGGSRITGYLWSNGSTRSTIGTNIPGKYTVKLLSGNCQSPSSDTVYVLSTPTSFPTVKSDTLCVAGIAHLSANGGNNNIGWYDSTGNYLLDSGFTYNPHVTGTTIFYAASRNGFCTGPKIPLVVKVYNEPLNVSAPFLCGPGVGNFQVIGGGNEIRWLNNQGQVIDSGAFFRPVLAQTDSFYAASKNKLCVGSRTKFIAWVYPVTSKPVIQVSGDGCNGQPIQLFAPTSGYDSLVWSSGDTSRTVSVTTSGTWLLTGYNNGCPSRPDTFKAVITPTISKPWPQSDSAIVICDRSIAILTAKAGYQYKWSTGETTQSIAVGKPGTYSYSLWLGNCNSPTSGDIKVSVGALPQVSAGPDMLVSFDTIPFQLTGSSPDGNNPFWIEQPGLSTSGLFDPAAAGVGIHKVVFQAEANNCVATDSAIIEVKSLKFVVNNLFTPNGDTYNEVWHINNSVTLYPDADVVVYNRWGKKVHEGKAAKGWDPKESAEYLPSGIYYYELILNNGSKPIKGNVTMIRE